eukprot:TRINITY_DN23459_c0_g1_i8.p1 TRINITY_DN23459_c0_g1~~TRINITY_DN23459_c0_g1_i8.p1  ORF type:complete len:208 (-),score=-11.07 TRINITY_DN23459_c0_g1_i8:155-778(-)
MHSILDNMVASQYLKTSIAHLYEEIIKILNTDCNFYFQSQKKSTNFNFLTSQRLAYFNGFLFWGFIIFLLLQLENDFVTIGFCSSKRETMPLRNGCGTRFFILVQLLNVLFLGSHYNTCTQQSKKLVSYNICYSYFGKRDIVQTQKVFSLQLLSMFLLFSLHFVGGCCKHGVLCSQEYFFGFSLQHMHLVEQKISELQYLLLLLWQT